MQKCFPAVLNTEIVIILGYLKDSNAAEHAVDSDIYHAAKLVWNLYICEISVFYGFHLFKFILQASVTTISLHWRISPGTSETAATEEISVFYGFHLFKLCYKLP